METHTLDASGEPLGRMASRIAAILMGKHRPSFERHRQEATRVVVTRSDELRLTGRKWDQKRYYRHSGYLGHLKEETARELASRDSREIVRRAVMGMLPKNRLRKRLIKNLAIYKGNAPEAH